MRKKIDYAATFVIIALGTTHTILTPVLTKKLNENPLDFVAIGLVFILIGFVNFIRIKTDNTITYTISIISNSMGLFWIILSFIYEESFVQGILPFIGLIIMLTQSIYNLLKFCMSILCR